MKNGLIKVCLDALKAWNSHKFWNYSLKINELIQSSLSRTLFFLTQLLLKIPAFELNNDFGYIGLELQIYNRYSSIYSSFTMFWPGITPLDYLSMYFLLFWLEFCLTGRLINAPCFILSDEDWRAGSIPEQPLSLVALMLSTQMRLHVP